MKDIVRLFVSLGLVCLIGCAALVWVNQVTQAPRDEARLNTLNTNLLMTLPSGLEAKFEESEKMTLDNGVVFHRAYANGKLAAIVAETSAAGFGGIVNALVGFDPATGKIVRVVVTEHSETPGLGSQATDRKEQKSLWHGSEVPEGQLPPNAYLDSFGGKAIQTFELGRPSEDKPQVVKGVSGATYSSKGVLAGVNKACEAYLAHKETLLQ